MTLEERIQEFVQKANQICKEYYAKEEFKMTPPTHKAEINGKWARIFSCRTVGENQTTQLSAYAFICMKDGQTKHLGKLKAGDIHMAASFKAPAKHARGTLFDPNYHKCMTQHGITYLR